MGARRGWRASTCAPQPLSSLPDYYHQLVCSGLMSVYIFSLIIAPRILWILFIFMTGYNVQQHFITNLGALLQLIPSLTINLPPQNIKRSNKRKNRYNIFFSQKSDDFSWWITCKCRFMKAHTNKLLIKYFLKRFTLSYVTILCLITTVWMIYIGKLSSLEPEWAKGVTERSPSAPMFT